MRTIQFSILALLTVFAASSIPSGHAAEIVCKELATATCSSNASCSWVKSYKTKKGREVAGFCRKKVARKVPKPTKAAS